MNTIPPNIEHQLFNVGEIILLCPIYVGGRQSCIFFQHVCLNVFSKKMLRNFPSLMCMRFFNEFSAVKRQSSDEKTVKWKDSSVPIQTVEKLFPSPTQQQPLPPSHGPSYKARDGPLVALLFTWVKLIKWNPKLVCSCLTFVLMLFGNFKGEMSIEVVMKQNCMASSRAALNFKFQESLLHSK